MRQLVNRESCESARPAARLPRRSSLRASWAFAVLSALALALALTTGACVIGGRGDGSSDDEGGGSLGGGKITYVDADQDGVTDGIDTNGDGVADYDLDCPTCAPKASPACASPLVDEDADSELDGLDLDCDGEIDIYFGGPGGGQNRCLVSSQTNGVKKSISCTSSNGGPSSCECRIDDQLVKTCSAPSASACTLDANCCGF